jgi:hypothetical protein
MGLKLVTWTLGPDFGTIDCIPCIIALLKCPASSASFMRSLIFSSTISQIFLKNSIEILSGHVALLIGKSFITNLTSRSNISAMRLSFYSYNTIDGTLWRQSLMVVMFILQM